MEIINWIKSTRRDLFPRSAADDIHRVVVNQMIRSLLEKW